MTKTDILKWCDKGNHEFRNADCLKSVKREDFYILQKCDVCPSMRVERL